MGANPASIGIRKPNKGSFRRTGARDAANNDPESTFSCRLIEGKAEKKNLAFPLKKRILRLLKIR